MSRPRAATSVATSSSVRPLRSRSTTPGALLLAHAAVQRLGAQAAAVSVSVTASTSSRVRQKTIAAVGASTSSTRPERGGGVRARHEVGGLADQRRLALGLGLAADPDGDRLAQVAAGQVLDAARHRRGEQHGLPGVRGGVEQGLDVLDEAHVEHLVGLVEHDDLELVQLQRAAVHQVDAPGPAWRRRRRRPRDSAAQLRADGGAAVDGQHPGAQLPAVAVHRLGRPAAASSRVGARTRPNGAVRAGALRALLAQALAASAARRRRSCRCRWRPDRAGRGPRPAARSPRPGSGWAPVAERGDRPLQLGAQREVGEGGLRGLDGMSGMSRGVSVSTASSGTAGPTTASFRVTSVSRRTEREHGRCTRGAKPADMVALRPDSGLSRFITRTDAESSHGTTAAAERRYKRTSRPPRGRRSPVRRTHLGVTKAPSRVVA